MGGGPCRPHFTLISFFQLLQDEYPNFLRSYKEEPWRGLRVNTPKIRPEKHKERVPFKLEPIPWCPKAFYLERDAKPGKHVFHTAGLYFIQNPSAMSSVEALEPKPGETVLDLCAAPGGKTTQSLPRCRDRGFWWSMRSTANGSKCSRKTWNGAECPPHHLKGEGHFVAVLENNGPEGIKRKPGKHPSVHGAAHGIFRDFVRKTFTNPNHFPGPFTLFGEHLYQVPEEFPSNKVSGRLLKNHYPKWAALGPVLRRPL
jgi:hypothetical protein